MTHFFELPMRLPSAANLREHWAVKARRVKSQRAAVRLGCMPLWHVGREAKSTDRYVVTLTRAAPRKLDDDNLAAAFKAMRDEVALLLRIDDGSPRIAWVYRQEREKLACVRIQVEVVRAQRGAA